jgi:hypothetical protein
MLTFLLLPAFAFAAPAAPTADALLANWRNAMYTQHEHSSLSLKLIDKDGTEVERKAELWYKSKDSSDTKILLRFNSPATIRGVAFLSLRNGGQSNSDQWVYFPAYKKARRLSSSGRDEAFLDSDFTNGDISFDYENAFDFTVAGSAKVEGQDTYRVEGKIKPARAASFAYAKEVLFFSKKNHLNLRTEFFDSAGKLVKSLTVQSWKEYAGKFTADKVTVKNEVSMHQSVLSFTQRDLKVDPADRLFTVNNLESGR